MTAFASMEDAMEDERKVKHAPSRRELLAVAAVLAFATGMPAGAAAEVLQVRKTSGCLCCRGWTARMREAGFAVEARDLSMGELTKLKLDSGLPAALASCHTATVGGYLIEGHVPAADIRRLLAERPPALGLAVPGMPSGSPGMAGPSEPYDVLLVGSDGSTQVFARHG